MQERINEDITRKTALHGAIAAQLQTQMGSCRDLERECAALVSRARHTSGKLMVGVACSVSKGSARDLPPGNRWRIKHSQVVQQARCALGLQHILPPGAGTEPFT